MPPDGSDEFRLPLSDRVVAVDRGPSLPLAPPRVTIPVAPPPEPEPEPGPEPEPEPRLFAADELLALVVASGSSDLHLPPGLPPQLRRNGRLEAVRGHADLSPDDVRRVLGLLLAAEHWERIDHGDTLTVVRPVDGLARFRINAFPTATTLAAVLHVIPWDVPSVSELGLPDSVARIADLTTGLVLVGGPHGSGRSTTLAALFAAAVARRPGHAVTIEGPIEFVHASRVGVVSQRDVGRDPLARADALRQTRHQDVDVVLVDELDDHAVLVEALTVAASGTLVLGSVRARTATEAIADAVQGFPLDRRPWGQRQLGDNLRAVVCQAWRPEGDGRRRVVAAEVLHMTEEIGRAVRDGDLATIGTAAP